jgi:hypothetical protein
MGSTPSCSPCERALPRVSPFPTLTEYCRANDTVLPLADPMVWARMLVLPRIVPVLRPCIELALLPCAICVLALWPWLMPVIVGP